MDFEVLNDGSFRFDVIVSDQPADATTRRSATCEVMVTLSDENDNIPIFEESLYETTVVENARVGITVSVVNADDSDSGSNGAISYDFLSRVSKLQVLHS